MGASRGRHTNFLAIAVFSLISILAFVALAGAGAEAKKKKSVKPVVKLHVITPSQALLSKGKVKVKVKSRRPARQKVKLTASLKVGSKKISKAGTARVSLRGKKKTVSIKLSKSARKLVKKCGKTRLTVVSKTGSRKSGKTARSLKKDSTRCVRIVPVASTIDLTSLDRCDFITESSEPRTEYLFPYPNDYFTKADSTTETGLRLNIQERATPENADRVHIDPTDINRSDGFSPGAPVIIQIPGMDTPQAFDSSGIVSIKEKSSYADADQPVVLIDAATGERQPIWAELDALAGSPGQTDLEIHFNKNLLNGHRYIVAMRDLRRADGSTIEAPDGFKIYRNRNEVTTYGPIEARRPHFESIFKTLKGAGIARDNLYLAWDFTVASTSDISKRMLAIRDDAFSLLGDNNLADSVQQGVAPTFAINPIDGNDNVNGRDGVVDFGLVAPTPPFAQDQEKGVENFRQINGTFQVPCYLDTTGVTDSDEGDNYINGCPSGSRFKLDANDLPIRTPGKMMTARFTCNIPRSAVKDDGSGNPVVDNVARPSLYGHGLFGDYTEGNTGDVRKLGNDHHVMVCATDWSGMAEDDVYASAIPALQDMSSFSTIPDRLQQGFLNFLYLGRLMKTTAAQGGFASDPAFQDFNGQPYFDPSQLYYYGNSQGGIAGGALTAIAPDFTRSVLYVPGIRYSELLPRSVDFDDYAIILYPSYPVERTRPLLLSMIQSLWDRGEPNGYANQMTSNPLPNTPAHKVMIEMAYGDHQVSNITAEAEARTIGATLHRPAIDDNRIQPGLIEPWYGEGTLGDLGGPEADGSAAFVWDIGPKRMVGNQMFGTDPSPLTNTPPPTTKPDNALSPGFDFNQGYGIDPHDTVIRQTPEVREQIANFLKVNGKVTNPCGSSPCYAAGWTGP